MRNTKEMLTFISLRLTSPDFVKPKYANVQNVSFSCIHMYLCSKRNFIYPKKNSR